MSSLLCHALISVSCPYYCVMSLLLCHEPDREFFKSNSYGVWPTTEEVTGGWRKLFTKELQNFYPSQNIIKVINS